MTKETAPLYLPLVQALAEGKMIESKDAMGNWRSNENPHFTQTPDCYRIKSKPREFWIGHTKDGINCLHNNPISGHVASCYVEIIHVQEVTP